MLFSSDAAFIFTPAPPLICRPLFLRRRFRFQRRYFAVFHAIFRRRDCIIHR